MGGPDSGMPELGDACIAAPFTYKFASLKSSIKTINKKYNEKQTKKKTNKQ